jgi:hypothetical protein
MPIPEEHEYTEKWAYVRHVERLRHQFVTTYVLIVGALLGFVLRGDISRIEALRGNQVNLLVLTFLSIYSLITSVLLLVQKRYYERYMQRLRDLDPHLRDGHSPVSTKFRVTTFRVYFLGVALLGAGIVGLTIYVAGAATGLAWGSGSLLILLAMAAGVLVEAQEGFYADGPGQIDPMSS